MLVRRSASLGLPLVVFTALAACSAGPVPTERTEDVGRASARVIKGEPSPASQDAVVMLIYYDPDERGFGECTGTLLAPNLVLTARHCVASTDEAAACDADGKPLAGGVVRGNHPADTLYVFTGAERPDFGSEVKPAGQGAKVLDDGGESLCNHDIAMIVLKEPIEGAQIAPIRLDSSVEEGDLITSVGWGVTDRQVQPDERQQREDVKVLAVGPDDARLPVPPNEFVVGESICSGDSGGPALADTGAVVGVVSRGGNARQQDPENPAATCIGGENLYTKVSPFKDFILNGFELAEAEPWIEGEPDPRLLKPGSACTDASECRSSLCLADPDQADATTCAQDCSESDCPEDQVCTVEGDVSVCRAPKAAPEASPSSTGGCSTSPAGGTPAAPLVLGALVCVGLVASRRRAPRRARG